MKLDKIRNYNVDLEEVKAQLVELENKSFKSRMDSKIIDRNKSLIGEYKMLKYMNDNIKNIKFIEYQQDYSDIKKDRILAYDEYKQNKNNTYGCDIIIHTEQGKTFYTDLKVLNYKEKYYHEYIKGKIYNGGINEKYGVDNLTFQLYQNANSRKSVVDDNVKGNVTKYGWGNNFYKNTDTLMVLIEPIGMYIMKYKEIVELIQYYKHNTSYEKHYFDRKKEIVLSVPCSDLPFDSDIKYTPMKKLPTVIDTTELR